MHLVMAGVTAPSHIYPSLGVLTELVSRGHRITYVVGDRLADLVASTGAEVLGHGSIMPGPETPWPDDPGEAMQVFLDEAIEVLPRMLEKIPAPDAVLYDIGGLAGRVAAHHWQVPAVQLSPAYVAWEGMAEETAEYTAQLKASPSGKHYYATLDAWLDEHDMSIHADDFLGTPDSCVALVPKALQPHADRVSDRYVFAGPCIDPARRTGWEPKSDDDRPLVYVALGTSYTDRPDIYRLCIDELAESYRLVISTGKVDPESLGPLPVGVQAARTQPQIDVLEHASVFITHAGMGSAAESLWFGVPTVTLPQAVDQFLNAATLVEIGTGSQPEEPLTGAGLRTAVESALRKADRARALRDEVRRNGGIRAAADAIEQLCSSTRSR